MEVVMSALVNELKEEHAMLVQILENVKQLGIGSREGKDCLASAKEALLSHLRKENEHLYPPLRRAAADNPHLRTLLDDFARDMESVETQTMRLFEDYLTGAPWLEFAREYGKVMFLLGTRIRREESMLYAEYEKLPATA